MMCQNNSINNINSLSPPKILTKTKDKPILNINTNLKHKNI